MEYKGGESARLALAPVLGDISSSQKYRETGGRKSPLPLAGLLGDQIRCPVWCLLS